MYKKSPYKPVFLLLFFIALSIFIAFFYSFNDTPANARNLQEEYKQIQEEMKAKKRKLEQAKKTERNVIEELRKLNIELAEINKRLDEQRSKIKHLQDNIHNLRTDINTYNQKLSYQIKLLKKRIKALQKMMFENDPLLVVLSGDDPTQVLKSIRYLKDISDYDRALIKRYHLTIDALNQKVKKLQTFESELHKEQEGLKQLEASYKDKKNQQEKLLVSVRKEKSHYENMIKELRESSNKIMRIIEESNRKERELKKKRGIEPAPNIKEEDSPEYTAFTKLKGKLPWPVTGSIVIPYGSQTDPLFNLPVFRSGIHIRTNPHSQVKAVYEGKVVFAESFKGFGQLVIVSHGGGYHTLYGNLSRIFLQNGAIIKDKQIIGEAGESQLIGTYGLYFEIRYKGKALNPEHWLKKA